MPEIAGTAELRPVAGHQHPQVAVQAIAQAGLFGDQLVAAVDEQLQVAVSERAAHEGQALLTHHDARDRESVGGVALAGPPGAAALTVRENDGHLAHALARGRQPLREGVPGVLHDRAREVRLVTGNHKKCDHLQRESGAGFPTRPNEANRGPRIWVAE